MTVLQKFQVSLVESRWESRFFSRKKVWGKFLHLVFLDRVVLSGWGAALWIKAAGE